MEEDEEPGCQCSRKACAIIWGIIALVIVIIVIVILIMNRSKKGNEKSARTIQMNGVTMDIEMYTDMLDQDDILVAKFTTSYDNKSGENLFYRAESWMLFPDPENPGMVYGMSCAVPFYTGLFKGHMIDVYNAYGSLKEGDYDDIDFSNEGDEIWKKTQYDREEAYGVEIGKAGQKDTQYCHAERAIRYSGDWAEEGFKLGYTYKIYNGVRIG